VNAEGLSTARLLGADPAEAARGERP